MVKVMVETSLWKVLQLMPMDKVMVLLLDQSKVCQ